jgi:16S rRNA (guanine527-N7)-methyltransferase
MVAADDGSLPALQAPLVAGLQALRVDPAPAVIERLLAYLALIARWNRVYNLTAVRDPADMLTQHLLDSLSVLPPLARQRPAVAGRTLRVLDVGSGAGLPGVVLAILRPDLQVTCVDAVAKKASFVRQVAGELALPNLRAEHARVEALKAAPFDLIASRAFASLGDFVNLTRSHLAPTGVWMAMKGRAPDDEVAALPVDVGVFLVEPLHVPGLQAQRCLIWMRPRG